MLPRVPLAATERDRAVAILIAYLGDESRIVVVNAMQALTELAEHDVDLRRRVHPLLERLVETGPPAVRARGRKLLTRLDRPPAERAGWRARSGLGPACDLRRAWRRPGARGHLR